MKISKTKILATVGPATESVETMCELIENGVDGFRLNFSHGGKDFFDRIFRSIDEACRLKSLPLSILIDLQGPKIRVGELKNEFAELKSGEELIITTEKIEGDNKRISTSYKKLVEDSNIGDPILIDDGLIRLKIKGKTDTDVICEVINGGKLKPRKGMNLPGMKLSTPALTEKDKENLEFALNHRVDFIALSFVREAQDITQLKRWLSERGKEIPVIAKIEKPEAVDNIDEIISVSDGIMVARGDLGVEMNPQEVPIIQKEIISKCNSLGKLVITATQMLESMISNPVPTRAEASDVANAVFDGTDVVMLSGETSVGKYPVKTVSIMNDILFRTEQARGFSTPVEYAIPENIIENLFDSTGKAVVNIAEQVNAIALVVFTHFGRKAKVIAKFNPSTKVFAISDKFATLNRLNLYRGIIPLFLDKIDSENDAVPKAKELLKELCPVKQGDVIMFTAGAPITDKERRTWTHFEII